MSRLSLVSNVAVEGATITVDTFTADDGNIETRMTAPGHAGDFNIDAVTASHLSIEGAVEYHLCCVQKLQSGLLPTLIGWTKFTEPESEAIPLSVEEAFIAVFDEEDSDS